MKELLKLLGNVWAALQNRRMLVIFLVFVIVVSIVVLQEMEVKRDNSVVQVESSASKDKIQSTTLQPVEANENKILKDPFAVAGSFHEKEEVSAMEKVNEKSRKNQKTVPIGAVKVNNLPMLTGIIGSGNRFLAILEYGEESKQCLLNDWIDKYQVVGIDEKNVILNGPNGAITLKVGR